MTYLPPMPQSAETPQPGTKAIPITPQELEFMICAMYTHAISREDLRPIYEGLIEKMGWMEIHNNMHEKCVEEYIRDMQKRNVELGKMGIKVEDWEKWKAERKAIREAKGQK